MKIAQYELRKERTFIIAEIAQAHDGSLGTAHAYIDALADAGVDAVKFQTHIARAESTLDEKFRVAFSKQDATRYDYWKRMEFTSEQWQEIADHCRARGVVFLSSAFSEEAVDLLQDIGMPAWKVGSGEFRSKNLLRKMGQTGSPILLSTGMSTIEDIDSAVSFFREEGFSHAIFQCTTSYPTILKDVGLNNIELFRQRYECPIGLSDHSGTVFPALAAMVQGVELLEVHAIFDKRMFGPDTSSSLTIEQFQFLCNARDAFYTMTSSPVDKNDMAVRLGKLRKTFSKSLALKSALPAGTVLKEEHLCEKKPGSGIPFAQKDQLVGKKLKHDKDVDRLLTLEDVE